MCSLSLLPLFPFLCLRNPAISSIRFLFTRTKGTNSLVKASWQSSSVRLPAFRIHKQIVDEFTEKSASINTCNLRWSRFPMKDWKKNTYYESVDSSILRQTEGLRRKFKICLIHPLEIYDIYIQKHIILLRYISINLINISVNTLRKSFFLTYD